MIGPIDGHSIPAGDAATESAAERNREADVLIISAQTDIGHGAANKHGTATRTAGAVMGDEIEATRKNIGWTYAPFVVPGWEAHPRGAGRQTAAVARARSRLEQGVSPPRRRRRNAASPGTLPELRRHRGKRVDAALRWTKCRPPRVAQNVLKIRPALPEMIGGLGRSHRLQPHLPQ